MIRINLLPIKELKAEVTRRRELFIGGIALAASVTILGVCHIYQGYRLSLANTELAELRQEIEKLDVQVKQVGDLEGKIKELGSKHTIIEDLNKKKVGPVRVMESLSSATPNALWLTEFKESGGNLTMSGMAIDNQTIAEFMTALSSIAYFNNLELIETTQIDQGAVALKKFSVKAGLSYQLPSPGLSQGKASPGDGKGTALR
jgi:type IV pilus assembly protein PilN